MIFFMVVKEQKSDFDYRVALANELTARTARNARYSLRSFARDLGVSVTALSDVLSGKRHFAVKNAYRVIEKLGWSPLQSEAFLQNIVAGVPPKQTREEILLNDDLFRVISDWYYLVILNWARVKMLRLHRNGSRNDWVSLPKKLIKRFSAWNGSVTSRSGRAR